MNPIHPTTTAPRWRAFFAVALLGVVLSSCSSIDIPELSEQQITTSGAHSEQERRNLFVLFDGTRNDALSKTNVFLMKEAIERSAIPATVLYIEGVGTLRDTPITGAALGVGMEARIRAGYEFLSTRFRPGDQILILGFSRGAHQARALAGLVSYAGLLDTTGIDDRKRSKIANNVIDSVKNYSDKDVEAAWLKNPSEPPKRQSLQQAMGITLRPASIAFVGLWDTVPGSSFKEYVNCREVPDSRPGERYKTGSYPSISRISHAVALDEKRSKFSPILLCPAMLTNSTIVNEVWFAGAHADVGGGYGAAPNGLNRVSMAWMISELSATLGMPLTVSEVTDADRLSAAHWSMGDSPANFRSRCIDRARTANAVIHESVTIRQRAGRAPLIVRGASTSTVYPFACSDIPVGP